MKSLRAIDLNLLTILDRLIFHENVSAAANDLGMTQSAVSHALARLRSHFEDDLFIRSPKGMVPTALTLQIKPELEVILGQISTLVAKRPNFIPEASIKTFKVGISEYAAQALFPRLRDIMLETAPNVQIVSSLVTRYDGMERMKKGELELLIGNIPDPDKSHNMATLYDDHFVVVGDKNNPLMTQKNFTMEDYSAARHVKIALKGVKRNLLDEHLKKAGHNRVSSFVLTNYTLGFPMVAGSPYLFTEPEIMCKPWLDSYHLAMRELPVAIPGFSVRMVWHRRFDGDPAHMWLRDILKSISKEIEKKLT